MQTVLAVWAWIQANKVAVGGILTGLYAALEVIVRLTPTTKDDTILERVGQYVGKLMDVIGIPNNKADGGVHAPINLDTGKPDPSLAAPVVAPVAK